VQESFSAEHACELFRHTFEKLLNGSGVSDECTGHLQSSWWDVTNSGLDVVRDPLDEVGAVLVLDVEHLFINFFHGHASSENDTDCQVSSVTWVASSHHVLGVEHLLGEFRNSQGTVLLRSSGGQWSESRDEEVETWEWNHVDGELSEVSVQLTWESQARGCTGHGGRDEVIQVTICWGGKFQSSEADIVQGFVVNGVCFVGVFDKLVDGEGGVVWFDDSVRYFWGWDDRESVHDSVWVFFTDLGDQ
jgi:hypothetical protein